jgi:hypothetical protein
MPPKKKKNSQKIEHLDQLVFDNNIGAGHPVAGLVDYPNQDFVSSTLTDTNSLDAFDFDENISAGHRVPPLGDYPLEELTKSAKKPKSQDD